MKPIFDHYNKDGETYSMYTHAPAVIVLKEEAHVFCDMTKRAFAAAVKKHPLPRTFVDSENSSYLDFELQTWMNIISSQKNHKPTWKKGLEKLKKLCLIDRTGIIHKLQDLYTKEWSLEDRTAYSFNDMLIKAYRRGVSDSLSLLCAHSVEVWDYTPKVNDVILVGSWYGIVSKLIGDRVLVQGTMIDENGESDYWVLEYQLNDILDMEIRMIWNSSQSPNQDTRPFIWDFRDLEFTRIV